MTRLARRTALTALPLVAVAVTASIAHAPASSPVARVAPSPTAAPASLAALAAPGLRAAVTAAVQRDADARFAFVDGAATHPDQDLAVTVEGDAVALTTRDHDAPVRLELARVGAHVVGEGRTSVDGSRVTIERAIPTADTSDASGASGTSDASGASEPALTEWYAHGPLGLEQGFTLRDARLAEGDHVALELRVEAPGYTPRTHGDALALTRAGRTLAVRELYASDATGRALPSHMAFSDTGLRIDVDVRGATYPVVIDPLYREEAKLVARDGDVEDLFGFALALDGDTALVGAFGESSYRGAAYVFTRSGETWSQEAKLTAATGVASDALGVSVALDGDTALIGANRTDGGRGAAYVFTRTGTAWS